MTFIYTCILVLVVAALILATAIQRIIVVDGREALLYRGGRFVRVLKAGTHWVFGWKVGKVELDIREANLTVVGQEVLTADQLTLKISVVLRYQLIKTEVALRSVQNYIEQLHLAVQEALRTTVAAKKARRTADPA